MIRRFFNKLFGEPEGISIFKTNISHIRNDPVFNKSLNEILVYARTKNTPVGEKIGDGESTVFDCKLLFQIKNVKAISDWLGVVIDQYVKYNNITNVKEAQVICGWCNRIYEHCEGRPHNHRRPGTSVSIVLYYDIPEGSSDLIIVDDKKIKDSYRDYEEKKLKRIKVSEGMAVCMEPGVIHAVGKHKSKLPRTVFVFDVNLK
jgi:hypothetical protein